MIRWQQKAANYDVFAYYQGLIQLRRAHRLFRLPRAEEIRQAIADYQSGKMGHLS